MLKDCVIVHKYDLGILQAEVSGAKVPQQGGAK